MTLPYDVENFNRGLVDHGLIIPSSVKGAYGRGAVFEDILRRVDDLLGRLAQAEHPQEMTFPPVLPRALIEKLGYLDSFPHLAGSIHSFVGNEARARELSALVHAGERWETLLDPTEVMLAPAACYPVYPNFSGLLPEGGRLVTVLGWVFRHEPSDEPTRLLSFRMREYIRAGRAQDVKAWRDTWLERGLQLFRGLGLPAHSDVATDPFFGRPGKMLAAQQLDQRLKFEIMVPVVSLERPTAVCSFNWHQDHFASKFGFGNPDGSVAHSACFGVGLERATLALIKTHGFDPVAWPEAVRAQLWP
ncbi:MAG: amino acid--[acyl-carrier-protein] ligase [Ramlibacter sp.]